MAVTVVLCNRTDGKSSKFNVNNVNLGNKVKDFRSQTSRLLNLPADEIDLIYCGQSFKDERSLESYGLRAGAIVHVLKKKHNGHQEQPEVMDSASIHQVLAALQSALINPAHRHSVDTMMSRPETMENLIAATPGLGSDPIALAMLQDPELLKILADPDYIEKVIESHPCLGHAAMMLAAAINEETTSSGAQSQGTGRSTYSLDQMSDDEEMGGIIRPPAQPITATQLAAALAAAGGGPPVLPLPAQSESTSSEGSSQRSGLISSDFFQQAILQAQGGSSSNTDNTTPQASNVSEGALQQLRDMGITDEVRARRALQLTGGDIQAALELLFGDNDL